MRRVFALCAAAGVAVATLAVTSPANAAFNLIRWNTTGACQIWDQSVPTKPWPSDYKVVSKPVPTFAAALAVKDGMLKTKKCSI